jgi:hypothetical protein
MFARAPRLLIAALALCGSSIAPAAGAATPCFTVSGTKVTTNNLFATGGPHLIDLEDLPSVSTIASRGPESHNLIFMKIRRDAAKANVTSFSVKVDGKDYEFPKDACKK